MGKLVWFLKRPAYYGELARKLRRRLSARNQRSIEAGRWCAERSVDTRTAVGLLTNEIDFAPVADRYPEEIGAARDAVSRTPIEMGGAGDLDLLYHLAEHLKARSVIETGVAYGWSALAILLSLRRRPDSALVSTDLPYAVSGSEAHVGVAVSPVLRSRWRLVKGPDRTALPQALALLPVIDMCHYDSAKAYEDRMWAYPRLWAALRPAGFLVSDDVGDNMAFQDFCATTGQAPVIAHTGSESRERKYVGVLVKP